MAATKSEQIAFLNKVYPAAKRLYAAEGIHPEFVTAQAALETDWGKKAIGNNIFGVTKGSWTGKTQLVLTTEYFKTDKVTFTEPEKIVGEPVFVTGKGYKYSVYRLFRDYDSVEDSLRDNLSVLKKDGYKDAWPFKDDPKEFARRISDNVGYRYGTEPSYGPIMVTMVSCIQKLVKMEGL